MKNLNKLNDKTFKRLLGVKRETYNYIVIEYKSYPLQKKDKIINREKSKRRIAIENLLYQNLL